VFLYNLIMKRIIRHVIPSLEGGWAVIKGGAERASKRFENKQDAEEWARQISMQEKGKLVIHLRDGTVESSYIFSPDSAQPVSHR
jgi:hypothetical protein